MILPFIYPQTDFEPSMGLLSSDSEWTRFGFQESLRRQFSQDEPEDVEPFNPSELAFLRSIFAVRSHDGTPLIRGHLLWEAMTWEPGEPMEPKELLSTIHSDDDEAREVKRMRAAAWWDKKGRKPKTLCAGMGGSRRRNPSQRRRHERAMASAFGRKAKEQE